MRLEDPKRETAAWALAADSNKSAAAREAGVDRVTIARWLKDEAFSARVDELQIQMLAGGENEGISDVAERGLARLIPMAEDVIERALAGELHNGKPVTATMFGNALKLIDLARRLEPAAQTDGAPSLKDLIREAESRASGNH